MARSGVYRTDVEKARRALMLQGKHPSIDAIRTAMGNTGSRTTIHRHLKDIEADETTPAGNKVAISDALQSHVARLAEQLHEEADAYVAQHKAESDAKVQEHLARAEEVQKEAHAVRDALRGCETSLAAESAKHQEAATQLQQARVDLAQQSERLTGLERRAREQDEHCASLEEKHKHARDALEHFRTATHEQRTREQRLHEQALQAAQSELRKAIDQLNEKNAEVLRLSRDNSRLLEQNSHVQAAKISTERELRQAADELATLKLLPAQLEATEHKAALAIAQERALQQDLDQIRTRLERTRDELHASRLDRASAVAQLQGMQAALSSKAEPEPLDTGGPAPQSADAKASKARGRRPRDDAA